MFCDTEHGKAGLSAFYDCTITLLPFQEIELKTAEFCK